MRINLRFQDRGEVSDLEVEIDEAQSAVAFYQVVAGKLELETGGFSLRLERLDELIQPEDPIADYALRSGDVLAVFRRAPIGRSLRNAALALSVIEGPSIGLMFPVPPDGILVGRWLADEELDLHDDSVSWEHTLVEFDSDGVRITDLDSTNGTWVNGKEIEKTPVPMAVGGQFEIGQTTFELVRPVSTDTPSHVDYDAGTLLLNRPPRANQPSPATTHQLPNPPQTPTRRRLPLIAALVPMAMGLAMAVLYNNPRFLLFMLGGPIMVTATYVSDRRGARGEFRKGAANFREVVKQVDEAAGTGRAAAGQWRRERDPAAAEVERQLRSLDQQIWHRRPIDDDFLSIRFGLADQTSLISVVPPGAGDEALRKEAEELAARHRQDQRVPVVTRLQDIGILGMAGDDDVTTDLAHWTALQVAGHHSPRDVAIAVLSHDPKRWEWLKWVPHARNTDVVDPLVPQDDAGARRLLDELTNLVTHRSQSAERTLASAVTAPLPHVVLFVEPPINLPVADLAALMDRGPDAGVFVVWLASQTGALPGHCRAVVDLTSQPPVIRTMSDGAASVIETVDSITSEQTRSISRMLAPFLDTTRADSTGRLPSTIDLFDLATGDIESVEGVGQRWQNSPPGLSAVLGAASDGPFVVDLVRDGPHALIGGTTGAGKSELLQSLIASVAATYPPDRVNFVLIDYKGGAAFKDCVALPHVVGFVTDLDDHLAERAIVSLNAELRWREHRLSESGFKDLTEMTERSEDAPARLVLIVDEFAALKSEVPDFVDGVVDIAQRGRSLGVHLVLATQKPRGVISADIQANTNLRIALRVTDTEESQDIVGTPDAARFSRHLPGRALVRTSTTEITEIQSAYVGGSKNSEGPETLQARTFHIPRPEDRIEQQTEGPSDLTRLVEACIGAAAVAGTPLQRQPWLPPLPANVDFSDLSEAEVAAPDCVIGLLDSPASQLQEPLILDLGSLGNAVIYGTSGSGKTTALRTIAAALAAHTTPEEVHLYGLDFAGRTLAAIGHLPHCGDVVFGDELDRVRRLIALLDQQLDQRRRLLAEAGAASSSEYRKLTGNPMPAIVTLIDGFGFLWQTLETLDRGAPFETLSRLIADGRGAGLYFVLTADRRGALPAALTGTIPRRIALRLANADEYSATGLAAPAGFAKLPPGRAWMDRGEAQIGVLSHEGDSGGAGQAQALLSLEAESPSDATQAPASVQMLPTVVALDEIPGAKKRSLEIPFGLSEDGLIPAVADFGASPTFLVAGPAASGRSTVLGALIFGLTTAHPKVDRHLITGRRTPLTDFAGWATVSSDPAAASDLITTLLESDSAEGRPSAIVVIDDADDMTSGRLAGSLERLVAQARDRGLIVLIAMSTFKALRGYGSWVVPVKHNKTGLILQPDAEVDGDVFQTRLPNRATSDLPGRACLVRGNNVTVVQVAMPPV